MPRKYLYRVFYYLLNGSTSRSGATATFPLHSVDAGVGYADTFFGISSNSSSIRIMHSTNRGHQFYARMIYRNGCCTAPFVGWQPKNSGDAVSYVPSQIGSTSLDKFVTFFAGGAISIPPAAAAGRCVVNFNSKNGIFSRWQALICSTWQTAIRKKKRCEWHFDGLYCSTDQPTGTAGKLKMR